MSFTIKDFAWRGLVAGAAGGAAAALFIRVFTETQIGFALDFEDAAGLGGPPGDPAEFSRATQYWGGMAAAVLYGAVIGLALAVAVAAVHHRVRARNEFGRVIRVAAAAFVAIVVLPGLKYPANPPAVGDPDTVGERTRLFLSLMGASILIVFAAWFLWEYLSERGWDGAPRFAAVGGAFVAVVALAYVVWPPSPDRIVPPDNEAAPALQVADDAPDEVLDGLLATARATDAEWLRDPDDPSEPLALDGPGAVRPGRHAGGGEHRQPRRPPVHDRGLAVPDAVARRVGADGRRHRHGPRGPARRPGPGRGQGGGRRPRRAGTPRRRSPTPGPERAGAGAPAGPSTAGFGGPR